MKYGAVLGLSIAIFALANMKESPSSKQAESLSIGLQVGNKAPAFASRDQFDHDQSLETLRGSSGTVLLFFRSADW
ncbi:MAG: hypothetical protein WCD49_09165 [Candidatus Acidiferrales bacterium]